MVPGFFYITSLTLTPGFAPVVRIMMVPAPYAPCPRTLRTSSSTALVPKAFGGPLGSLRLISLKLRIFGTLLFLVRLGLLRRCDLQSLLACSGTFGNAGMRSSSTKLMRGELLYPCCLMYVQAGPTGPPQFASKKKIYLEVRPSVCLIKTAISLFYLFADQSSLCMLANSDM